MKNKVLLWEIGGFIFVGLVGAGLHFTYELSDFSSNLVAYFSAVNESTWEHLKMAFFPALLFAIVQYTYVRHEANNYLVAKTVSLFLMPFVIVVGWYAYAPALGRTVLTADISLFYVAVGVGQYASYKILTMPPLVPSYHRNAIAAFAIMFVAFSTFTFRPPNMFLFEHLDLKDTGQYGILPYEDNPRYFTEPPSRDQEDPSAN